ncbi:MAG TPA: cache domain-containing protein, partial [Aggregatilineales bacterium]|nr:cache domain-containing protein [Aggregatilineales bacterium]
MNIFRHLQFRLLLVLIVVASVPIGVVSIINYSATTNLVTEEVEARQTEVTHIISEQVTLFVQDITRTLQVIGRAGFMLSFDTDQLNDYIANYLIPSENGTTIYRSIWLMDADGNEIAGIFNGEPLSLETIINRAEDEIFFRPERGEIYFSNVRVINQSPEISLSVPIYDNAGVFIGVVGAIIDLETAWDIIRDLQLGQTGYAMLLDRRGNVIVHRDSAVVDARYNLADSQPFAAALRDQSVAVYQYNSPIGGNVVGSAQPIMGPNWVLMVERPTQEAFATISQAVQNIFLGLVIAIIISALISLLLSRQIARPIIALRNAVHQFGAGALNTRSKVTSQDEIGQLSEGFNAMADRLKTRIEEINLKNHELQLANEKVLEASRLKDEFLAIMSHELRTPLSAIIGFSGVLLMDNELDEQQTFQVQRIETNSERLLNLINDILDISRIQAGRMS